MSVRGLLRGIFTGGSTMIELHERHGSARGELHEKAITGQRLDLSPRQRS
jgi:hypothetical protein